MTPDEEARAVIAVVDRLVGRFPDVRPEVVGETIATVHSQLRSARVHDFVPVLVEHRSVDLLRTITRRREPVPA